MLPVIATLLTALQAVAPAPIVHPAIAPELDGAAWTAVGSVLPSIELPRVDGSGPVDLADLRGRKVLLIQFAAW